MAAGASGRGPSWCTKHPGGARVQLNSRAGMGGGKVLTVAVVERRAGAGVAQRGRCAGGVCVLPHSPHCRTGPKRKGAPAGQIRGRCIMQRRCLSAVRKRSRGLRAPFLVRHRVRHPQVINGSPGEYDTSYGFLAFFHTIERPNKLVVRTFHKWVGTALTHLARYPSRCHLVGYRGLARPLG